MVPRTTEPPCAAKRRPATGSGAGSASASASGTGLSLEDTTTATTDDPEVLEGVTRYKAYVEDQVDELIAATTVFTNAVRAGDLPAARAAYAPSREAWERIEPIAGLISDVDSTVDSRVDDFAGPDDPAFTGWHRLEYLLFEKNTTKGAAKFADGLDTDLASLKSGVAALEIPPAAVALGASELIQEVSEGKITGEEDRYSKTDLWDFNANVEGSQKVDRVPDPGAPGRPTPTCSPPSRPASATSGRASRRCARARAGCSSARRTTSSRRPSARSPR